MRCLYVFFRGGGADLSSDEGLGAAPPRRLVMILRSDVDLVKINDPVVEDADEVAPTFDEQCLQDSENVITSRDL